MLLVVVFCIPVVRCNECKGGFVCGDLHSIVGEPLFSCVDVVL